MFYFSSSKGNVCMAVGMAVLGISLECIAVIYPDVKNYSVHESIALCQNG